MVADQVLIRLDDTRARASLAILDTHLDLLRSLTDLASPVLGTLRKSGELDSMAASIILRTWLERIARKTAFAAEALSGRGHRVRVATLPEGRDLNDLLQAVDAVERAA